MGNIVSIKNKSLNIPKYCPPSPTVTVDYDPSPSIIGEISCPPDSPVKDYTIFDGNILSAILYSDSNILYIFRINSDIKELFKYINMKRNLKIILHTDSYNNVDTLEILYFMLKYKRKNVEINNKIKVYIPYKALGLSFLIGLLADELYCNEDAKFSQMNYIVNYDKIINDIKKGNYPAQYLTEGIEKCVEKYITSILNEDKLIAEKFRDSAKLRYSGEEWDLIMDTLLINPKFLPSYKFTVDDIKTIGVKIDGTCPDELIENVNSYINNYSDI
jgi:hypothetical protein